MAEGPIVASAWLDATSYWVPQHLVPSAWHEHAPFAFWLVNHLRPSTITELGTHNGFSFFVFCEAVKRLRLDAKVVAIDTWRGDEHAGFYGDEVYQSVSQISHDDYADCAVLERGYFDDVAARTEDGSVDLLHIDGRHRLEDVAHDFATWLPKVSDRGVVLLHDTAEHRDDFGVWQFWDDVRGAYPSFGFTHGHGLGVLLVGENVPPAVTEFVVSATADPANARSAFERLGRRIGILATTAIEHRALLETKNRLENEKNQLAQKNAETGQARRRLVAERDELAEERRRLERELSELVRRNDELTLSLATAERERRKVNEQFDEASAASEHLRTELEALVSSTSWRVTAPARAITGRIKGRKAR